MSMMNLLRLLVLAVFCVLATSHESCCKHKQQQVSKFKVDPTDVAPQYFQGHPRWISDPEDERPDDWDDEDDGLWEPNLLLNPEYIWEARRIPNPNYKAPPTYWDKLYSELQAAIPWVTLGVLVTGILTTISLPLETLRLHLSSGNSSGLFQAALLGLATPLCSCGALPIAAGLLVTNSNSNGGGGVPLAAALTFLTASQSAGLDSAAITWGLLGPTAVLCRLGGAIALAVAAGWAASYPRSSPRTITTTTTKTNDKKDASCCKPPSETINSISTTTRLILTTLIETTTEILPTVLAGLAISTAALQFLPSLTTSSSSSSSGFDLDLDEANHHPSSSLLVRLGVLLSAVPLQLCEHSTVTLAAAIPKAGGSPGVAFSFLLSAPAINMPSLLFLWKHGGVGVVIRVVLAIVSTALVLSYAVDVSGVDDLLRVDVDVGVDSPPGDGSSRSMTADLPQWYVVASPWLVGGLFLAGMFRRFYYHSPASSPTSSCCSTTTITTPEDKDKPILKSKTN